MSEHPSTRDADHNLPVLTVGEISLALKRHVESGFERVRVRGEITGFKRAASGHLYFALKDPDAVLKGVCWRGAATRLGIAPEDGMEVIAFGRLTTYPGRSEYQLVVESLELAGEGALLKLLEERKRRLAAEGLFAPERKRPIPFLPEVIGVVTSPTGAVIRDILHRLEARFPRRVLLWPVLVQGDGAAAQIAAAIDGFNRLAAGGPVPRPDVLIVARGGGSLEDLLAFSEEIVVRAAAASDIPLISGVGHETDTTLIDFAADRRAPTPTAAAEMAVPVRMDILAQVLDDGHRLVGAMSRMLEGRRMQVIGLARGLPRPMQLVDEARQRLDDRSERLGNALLVGLHRRRDRLTHMAARLVPPRSRLDQGRSRLEAETRALASAVRVLLREHAVRLGHAAALLESFSYQRVLERGFVLVNDSAGATLTSSRAVRPAMRLTLQFQDGAVDAVASGDAAAPMRPPRRRTRPADDDQGSLL